MAAAGVLACGTVFGAFGDDARKAHLLNELNTSFHGIVRTSGGNNGKRLLMLPTEVCTPDQRLMNNLATTIKSLRDPRLIATVHYYGYWPFSVNVAGTTRFDATVQKDLSQAAGHSTATRSPDVACDSGRLRHQPLQRAA